MKKLLGILLFGVFVTLVSCAQQQCNCNLNGDQITFSENDAKDAGVDLQTYCDGQDVAVKLSGTSNSCNVE